MTGTEFRAAYAAAAAEIVRLAAEDGRRVRMPPRGAYRGARYPAARTAWINEITRTLSTTTTPRNA